jgi:Ca2+-binding EF-hand superfamily protein
MIDEADRDGDGEVSEEEFIPKVLEHYAKKA